MVARGGHDPHSGERPIQRSALILSLLFVLLVSAPGVGARSLYGPMPRTWHAPRWWLPQAVCIHDHEGAWNDATGNGYEGGMQFLRSTWVGVGGRTHGYHWASVESPREQLYRAWLVYVRDGHSWHEWGTARACGLR